MTESAYPSRREFLKLSRRHNLIPVCREILADMETPVSCFLKIGDRPHSYLLESVEGGEKIARYSFIGGTPSKVFESRGRDITVTEGTVKRHFRTKVDPLYELEKLLSRTRQPALEGLPPFTGGAVGYLGYDTVRFLEKIPDKNADVLQIPDSLFLFTDTLIAFDHVDKKIKVIANVDLDDKRWKGARGAEAAYRQALEKIDALIRRIQLSRAPARSARGKAARGAKLAIRSNFSRAAFQAAVGRAKRYIRAGDIFQVVLSQAFRTPARSEAFDIYRALRSVNPSPYMFYLNLGDFRVAGSSPEVHVRCLNGRAALRPIAGTRPRGSGEAEDKKLEKDLLADPKERAEHVMLVDLGRNDLGRVCGYRSIRVPEFMTVERYSHVMHLVSHVEGRLRKGCTPFDLMRATFPAGTISGAPKVRAMQIIDELENQRRGFYSGVVGYFSYSGNLDSCIAIRSLLLKDGQAVVQAGAGIVADSKPAKEYEETVNKAKALFHAVELAQNGRMP